jgi:hypothetical protein
MQKTTPGQKSQLLSRNCEIGQSGELPFMCFLLPSVAL